MPYADPEDQRRWYRENGKEWHRKNRARRCAQNRRYRRERRTKIFDHYGWSCICCGTEHGLTIDHIVPREPPGSPRKSPLLYCWLIANDFPEGFQTLCSSCNQSKHDGERCTLDHSADVKFACG